MWCHARMLNLAGTLDSMRSESAICIASGILPGDPCLEHEPTGGSASNSIMSGCKLLPRRSSAAMISQRFVLNPKMRRTIRFEQCTRWLSRDTVNAYRSRSWEMAFSTEWFATWWAHWWRWGGGIEMWKTLRGSSHPPIERVQESAHHLRGCF